MHQESLSLACGPLAQSAERGADNAKVVSSSLTRTSLVQNLPIANRIFLFFLFSFKETLKDLKEFKICKKYPSIQNIHDMTYMTAKEICFSSCHEGGTEKKFWVPKRNRPSDLRIPRSDALPLRHRDYMVSEVYYEVHITPVLHTAGTSNVDSL